jgi:hypothetical protein
MKLILKSSLALATLIAVAGLFSSSAAGKGHAATYVTVTGGSIGDFVATPHSLTTSGFTDFAVDVTVRRDGTATGEFVCAVPGFVVLGGQATNGQVNADGSVTVTGLEYGYDTTIGGYSNCPFSVTFRAGGPGVGGFDFSDCVFPTGMYDTEIIRVGSIQISR